MKAIRDSSEDAVHQVERLNAGYPIGAKRRRVQIQKNAVVLKTITQLV